MSREDFSCGICYDLATEPVVTRCGHLFCWNCLDQWLGRRDAVPECPVCRGRVDKRLQGDIIPLYGKGRQTHAAGSSSSVKSSSPPQPQPHQRHEQPQRPRPAADRAPPVGRPGANYVNHPLSLGIGSSFFIYGGNMSLTLLLVALWAIYHFAPWRQVLAGVRGGDSSQGRTEQMGQQENNTDSEARRAPRPDAIVRRVLLSVAVAYIIHYLFVA
ncbi:E3 ubiquitin-protein ligase RNF5 [Trypanosoma conorhini]|uniref:RING-type E3 ubiquitin transferase n=1 Tax=Trypanosoma conorhini TaxID=83891 RepID=A0A422MVY2_9TRYP|nr:E3 ubiquitin-protein ligase RNF5 [Trypanosoma conorhini]RNE97398.1 E3 ubiquitin-protein ligase RNF5 [Trypanosoma conorhini]